MARKPSVLTHYAKHRLGGDASIHITDDLWAAANVPYDTETRRKARASICIRFRKACSKKFPGFGITRIEWSDLTITPLEEPKQYMPPARRSPGSVKPKPAPPRSPAPTPKSDEHCCEYDNCAVCDVGNHHHCRRGCTLFR